LRRKSGETGRALALKDSYAGRFCGLEGGGREADREKGGSREGFLSNGLGARRREGQH